MSNNNGTEIRAWASNVGALYEEYSRPILSEEDARWQAVSKAYHGLIPFDAESAKEYGATYFERVALHTLIPACPLPVPAWGVERKLEAEGPNILIWDYSQEWTSEGVSIQIERATQILCAPLPDDWNADPDGKPLPGEPDQRTPGTVDEFGTELCLRVGKEIIDVTPDQARGLVGALSGALSAIGGAA